MAEILVTAALFLFSTLLHLRAYSSDDEKYKRLASSPYLKPSSLFMTQTHTMLFGLPPAFGAATAFLIYMQLGGEVNFVSVFLLLLALILGPYLLVKRFNDHKQAHAKRSQTDSKIAPVEAIFTRSPLSPEKYRLYGKMIIIQASLIVLTVVGIFVLNAINRSNRQEFEGASKNLLAQELSALGVDSSELSPASIECRAGHAFIYTDEYLRKNCTVRIEIPTKRFDFQATKETLLQNSWQLTKEEDFGKKYHT